MLVQVLLELLEFLIGDHKGGTGIARDGIVVGQVANGVDRLADLLVFPVQPFQRGANGCPVPGRRFEAGAGGRLRPLDRRKEDLLLFLEVGGQVSGDPGEEIGYLQHLGMVGAMHPGYLAGIGRDLVVILPQIHVVGVDDVVGEERERPGSVVFTAVAWLVLHRFQFPHDERQIEPVLGAGRCQRDLAAAAEIDAPGFEHLGCAVIGGDNGADGGCFNGCGEHSDLLVQVVFDRSAMTNQWIAGVIRRCRARGGLSAQRDALSLSTTLKDASQGDPWRRHVRSIYRNKKHYSVAP